MTPQHTSKGKTSINVGIIGTETIWSIVIELFRKYKLVFEIRKN